MWYAHGIMDYYNDFQRIVRSDDIGRVIDRFAVKRGRDVEDPSLRRDMDDVLCVVDAIKAARETSYPALINLACICASLTVEQFSLFAHVLCGWGLTEYANSRGVSREAVHRQWRRIVAKNPSLADMARRRTACTTTTGKASGTRRTSV